MFWVWLSCGRYKSMWVVLIPKAKTWKLPFVQLNTGPYGQRDSVTVQPWALLGLVLACDSCKCAVRHVEVGRPAQVHVSASLFWHRLESSKFAPTFSVQRRYLGAWRGWERDNLGQGGWVVSSPMGSDRCGARILHLCQILALFPGSLGQLHAAWICATSWVQAYLQHFFRFLLSSLEFDIKNSLFSVTTESVSISCHTRKF